MIVFSLLALFVTMTVFLGRLCFGWFRGLSPIKYSVGDVTVVVITPGEVLQY